MEIGINLIAQNGEKHTGAFRYIVMLLREISKYQFSDCHFVIYKQRSVSIDNLAIPHTIDIEYIDVPNLKRGFDRIIFEQTLFYFYLKRCDVFYSYCTSMPLFVHAKKVFTLHDVYYLLFKHRYPLIQRIYLKYATKILVRRADVVLTVSEYSKDEICKFLNVNTNKIAITYNFVKASPIVHSDISVFDEFGVKINFNIPFFLYIGNIQPGKNVEGMINGFKKFNLVHNEYNLFIVGKNGYKGEQITQSIRGTRNVVLLGYQERCIVDYLLNRCYATVLVSFCEGFGIPPIEGFIHNKPSLVSSLSSLPEVVGEAGIKVDPFSPSSIAEGFAKVVENYDLLCSNIYRQLAKFDPSVSGQVFLKSLGITDYEIQDKDSSSDLLW